MCNKYDEKIALLKELSVLFMEAVDFLEYCGYGDSWERECAEDTGLIDRIDEMKSKIKSLNTQ